LYKFIFYILFFFNYYLFFFIFSTNEILNNNHIRIFNFNIFNKYLILISFIIFIRSYFSIIRIIHKERIIIFLFLTLLTLLLFSTYNILLFFIILERVLIPIVYLFFYYREYIKRYTSLSYIFFITVFLRSPFFFFVLMHLKKGFETYISFSVTLNNFYFFLLILGFLIKLPVYRFHYWLPKAHVDAPVGGSIILAGIILKYRRYRLIRSVYLVKFFNINYHFMLFIFLLGGVRYIIIAFICVQILDLKVLIAFSSVSHISFAILGNINCNFLRLKRSIFIYLRHGLISPLLFLIAYILYKFTNTRLLNGIFSLRINKKIIFLLIFLFLINLGLPPFINFLSEIFILTSLFSFFNILFFFIFLGFIFNRIYHIKILSLLLRKKNLLFKYNINFRFIFLFIIYFLFFSVFFIFI